MTTPQSWNQPVPGNVPASGTNGIGIVVRVFAVWLIVVAAKGLVHWAAYFANLGPSSNIAGTETTSGAVFTFTLIGAHVVGGLAVIVAAAACLARARWGRVLLLVSAGLMAGLIVIPLVTRSHCDYGGYAMAAAASSGKSVLLWVLAPVLMLLGPVKQWFRHEGDSSVVATSGIGSMVRIVSVWAMVIACLSVFYSIATGYFDRNGKFDCALAFPVTLDDTLYLLRHVVAPVAQALIVVAAFGCLARKRWGRMLLMIACCTDVTLGMIALANVIDFRHLGRGISALAWADMPLRILPWNSVLLFVLMLLGPVKQWFQGQRAAVPSEMGVTAAPPPIPPSPNRYGC